MSKKYIDIIEGILLSAKEPISIKLLNHILKEFHDTNTLEIKKSLEYIQLNWAEKTLELVEVDSGWRFQTKDILHPYLNLIKQEKPQKYSRATLEILSIIAYKQPVTKGDIETVRGVSINNNSIKLLEDRGWIEVIGQREVIGRPNLYGTTTQFLQDLGLLSLGQLPPLQEQDINV